MKHGGAGTDTTKTTASRRVLPIPMTVLPWLVDLAGDRPKSDWLFPSTRKAGCAIATQFPNQALTRAITKANGGRPEQGPPPHRSRAEAHLRRHLPLRGRCRPPERLARDGSRPPVDHARPVRAPLEEGSRAAHGEDRRDRRDHVLIGLTRPGCVPRVAIVVGAAI